MPVMAETDLLLLPVAATLMQGGLVVTVGFLGDDGLHSALK